jgi:hypothetical protein
MRLASLRSSRKLVFFIAKLEKSGMESLRGLLEPGKVTPVVDSGARWRRSVTRSSTWGRATARRRSC